MPSPLATDQHHNQLNRNERETGRQRNKEWEPERIYKPRERKREEAEKGGMLSAKDLYQNSVPCQHPCRALIWSACLFRHCEYCTLWEREKGLQLSKTTGRKVSLLLYWNGRWGKSLWFDAPEASELKVQITADVCVGPTLHRVGEKFPDAAACQARCLRSGSWQ